MINSCLSFGGKNADNISLGQKCKHLYRGFLALMRNVLFWHKFSWFYTKSIIPGRLKNNNKSTQYHEYIKKKCIIYTSNLHLRTTASTHIVLITIAITICSSLKKKPREKRATNCQLRWFIVGSPDIETKAETYRFTFKFTIQKQREIATHNLNNTFFSYL